MTLCIDKRLLLIILIILKNKNKMIGDNEQ